MKLIRHIRAAWAACLAAVSLAACSDSDQPIPGGGEIGGNDSGLQIAFNVAIPKMDGSRATYEDGVGAYENTIDLANNDFRVLIFSYDDKKLICSIDPAEVQLVENDPITNSRYKVYTLYAKADPSLRDHNKIRCVLIANWREYPALNLNSTTFDDLAGYAAGTISTAPETTFDANGQLVAADGKHIPMFGVKDCPKVNWVDGIRTWLGDLWLLRAVAKIEVMKGVENMPDIESVTLSHYNKLGTCAPKQVYAEADYVVSDNYKPAVEVTLPGGANDYDATPCALTPAANGRYVVYVPEYQILPDPSQPTAPSSDRPKLSVKMQGIDKIYTLEFKYYTQPTADDNEAQKGDFFDLKRNYIYRYRLFLSDVDLNWQVDVLPYLAVELKPDFGLPLPAVTLDKYVVELYTDPNKDTNSSETIRAYDNLNNQYGQDVVEWRISDEMSNSVCEIAENPDGSCTIRPLKGKNGHDKVIATILDKNGAEVTAECVVLVGERHLGIDKTFLGLLPQDDETSAARWTMSYFKANVVAEIDNQSTISWDVEPVSGDMLDDLTITVNAPNGAKIENGGKITDRDAIVTVKSGKKVGTAKLWLHYNGPDPENPGKRVTYSTCCEITVQPVVFNASPKKLVVEVGRKTSMETRLLPLFSDYIAKVYFRSKDPNIATVDENGLITGVNPGVVKIEAYVDDESLGKYSDDIEVTVKPASLILFRYDGVTEADQIGIIPEQKISVRAFSNGVDVSKSCTWSYVGEKSFFSVNKGVVTGNSVGSATLQAEYNGVTATCVIVVANRKLIIAQHPHTVSTEASVPMNAYIFPDTVPYDKSNTKVTWSSSDTGIVAFDDPDDKSIAVAKKAGTATLTAEATYGGVTYTATSEIAVRGIEDVVPPEFALKIYDENGKFVTEVKTEYAYYPGHETNQGGWNQATDVRNIFDNISIPIGKTWNAVISFSEPNLTVSTSAWSKSKRFTGYDDRITIAPAADGKSCKITAKSNVHCVFQIQ